MSIVTLIVARAENGVIGRDGGLPWHIPDDLKRFKRLTMGKPMVMGRKTFESLPGPLPGRRHIVLSRGRRWKADGAEVVRSVEDTLEAAGGDVSIIGGAEIFALFEPIADAVELTEIHASPEGDTRLPPFDPARWREVSREDHGSHSFVRLERAR